MQLKVGLSFAAVCAISLVLAGCGGDGNKHTYVITPTSPLAAGIYLTIVSPVALPQSVLDQKSITVAEKAVGPEVCSYSKQIEGVKGKYADLNGKTVTLKVNGSNGFIGLVCGALKKGGFNPTNIQTH